jgi:hypothetical protein
LTWDLTNARLAPLAGVQTLDDYLVRLDDLVAVDQLPARPEHLPPTALPEAFDHLGLAWRIARGERPFHLPRAAVPAKLTQPAASAEEFESQWSAVADMLKSFNLPAQGGSMNNMKARLSDLHGNEADGRAHGAVDTLRQIFARRPATPHGYTRADGGGSLASVSCAASPSCVSTDIHGLALVC